MTCQELLDSIVPGMKLTKDFFKRVYSREIEYPGFSEKAISKLEAAGCSKARQYYDSYVNNYVAWYKEECGPAAEWLVKQINDNYERKRKKVRMCMEMKGKLMDMSDKNLIMYLKNLIREV